MLNKQIIKEKNLKTISIFSLMALFIGLIFLVGFLLLAIYSQIEENEGNISKKDTTKENRGHTLTEDTIKVKFIIGENIDLNCQPKQKLWVINNEKNVTISVDHYNSLTRNNEWELLCAYRSNNFYKTRWKNRKTNKEVETIGTYPPSENLIIKKHEKND